MRHRRRDAGIPVPGDAVDVLAGRLVGQFRDRGGADMDVAFCGLWYRDHLVRTTAGWRIKARVEERSWIFNALEANMPVPPPYVPPETTA